MTETELLTEVKKGLGISGTYQDLTLLRHLRDVKAFCLSSGVASNVLDSEVSVGLILRGIADLWNLGSGDVRFSPYFLQRLIQLATMPSENPDVST
jgi:hypothetical protein